MSMFITRTLAILTLTAGSIFLASCKRVTTRDGEFRSEQPRFSGLFQIVPQKASVRTLAPWTPKLVWKASGGDLIASVLVQLQAGASGEVYGLDRATGCIIRLDRKRNEQLCLRDDRNKLPIKLTNITLDEDGRTLIASTSEHRLWKRTADGSVSELRRAADVGYFVVDRRRLVYLSASAPVNDSSFGWIDVTDANSASHLSEVPRLLDNDSEYRFAILGKLAADRQQHMVYHVSDRCGLLLGLGNDPNNVSLRFARTTVDHTPIPRLELATIRTAKVTRFAFGQPLASLGVGAEGGKVWVLAVASSGAKTFKEFLDVYDGKQGDYLHSYELPIHAHTMSVHNGRLYFSVDGGVEVWEAPSFDILGSSRSSSD